MPWADEGGSRVPITAEFVLRGSGTIFFLCRLVCLTCFSWKLVGVMTTATAVAVLEVALAVSVGFELVRFASEEVIGPEGCCDM